MIEIHDNERKRIGQLGEDIACQFLVSKGFTVLERNYRKPWGEIDIVAEKDGIVRFIEVKSVSREILENGSREMDYAPEEMATADKLRKVSRTASLYMDEKRDSREFQVDVVGVILNQKTRQARCRLIEQVL